MLLSFEVLKDFLSTIAFMALLAVGYGSVMRAFKQVAMAQAVLGILFGAAAVVAMLDPLYLVDGVIVDLRSVPLTLAGAFLGLPGAMVATLMALATRVSLGGTGVAAGSTVIALSALIGLGWATFLRRPGHGVQNVVLLAALSQIPLVAYFMLPWSVAWSAVTTVWPVFVPLRFAGVLIVAALLKRERNIGSEVKQLVEEATHDPLTGLLNRRGFEAAVRRLRAVGPGSALLILDLDHFKRVNDTHGHVAGDMVLQALATRLLHALRLQGMVARFGGEEMVVFLPDVHARMAMDAAARLCEAVRSQRFILANNVSVVVTASVGGTWATTTELREQIRLEDLLREADAALYKAKEDGRNCWRFDVGGYVTGSPTDASRSVVSLAAGI